MDRRALLGRLDKAWKAFTDSYAGLSETDLLEPGVTKAWSARDIIAHVTTGVRAYIRINLLGTRIRAIRVVLRRVG